MFSFMSTFLAQKKVVLLVAPPFDLELFFGFLKQKYEFYGLIYSFIMNYIINFFILYGKHGEIIY